MTQIRYCTNCGHPNDPNMRFCTECGTLLAPPQEEPAPPADAGRRRQLWPFALLGVLLLLIGGGALVAALQWDTIQERIGGNGSVVIADSIDDDEEEREEAEDTETPLPSTETPTLEPSDTPTPVVEVIEVTRIVEVTPTTTPTATPKPATEEDAPVVTEVIEVVATEVVIDSRRERTFLPAQIEPGDEVQFFVTEGRWRPGPAAQWPLVDGTGDSRVAGKVTFPVPSASLMSLVAGIGNGDPFYVGQSTVIDAVEAGQLWLGPNDDDFGDNGGSITVSVRVFREEAVSLETEPEGPITLRLFAGNVGFERELSQAAAVRFMEQNPNITVEVIDNPSFVEDRLGTYLQLFEAQSPAGDVFQIDVIWPGDLAEHLVDLYQFEGVEGAAAQHFPAIVENNTVDGALVGIPWFTDAGLLYYRSDLLVKYGYTNGPETWDELEEMAATIQEGEREAGNRGFWGFVWQGSAYEGLTCDALEWIYSNGGGTVVSPEGEITINNAQAVEAVDRAAGWVGTISPPGITGYTEEDARGVWQAGNAAFMRNWPYAYFLGNAMDSPIAGRFDVQPLPAGDAGIGAATLAGWQLAVSRYSDHPEAAARLALFLTSAQEQKIRAVEGSLNPTIESLYSDPDILEANPFSSDLYDVFINAVARPSTVTAPHYAATTRLFHNAVHDVLTGRVNANSAFSELEEDLEELLGFPTGPP